MTAYRLTLALCLVVTCVACGGQSEATREAEAMKAATPNRVQADGSIRLTDADRQALGVIVEPAADADLPLGYFFHRRERLSAAPDH